MDLVVPVYHTRGTTLQEGFFYGHTRTTGLCTPHFGVRPGVVHRVGSALWVAPTPPGWSVLRPGGWPHPATWLVTLAWTLGHAHV